MKPSLTHLQTIAAKVGYALVKTDKGFMLHRENQSIHVKELTTIEVLLAQRLRRAA